MLELTVETCMLETVTAIYEMALLIYREMHLIGTTSLLHNYSIVHDLIEKTICL